MGVSKGSISLRVRKRVPIGVGRGVLNFDMLAAGVPNGIFSRFVMREKIEEIGVGLLPSRALSLCNFCEFDLFLSFH